MLQQLLNFFLSAFAVWTRKTKFIPLKISNFCRSLQFHASGSQTDSVNMMLEHCPAVNLKENRWTILKRKTPNKIFFFVSFRNTAINRLLLRRCGNKWLNRFASVGKNTSMYLIYFSKDWIFFPPIMCRDKSKDSPH